jgi:Uma2 family endonuclease
MATAVVIRPRVSVDEYLAMEAAATEKHILWDGEVFSVEAMSGGTFDHNTICANVITGLGVALRGSRCRVVTSDQKVWVPRKEGFVYPDATVVCGRIEAYPGTTDVLNNPSLIVEVLSEGTERFDRGEKFEGYRTIESLQDFVMVSSQRRLVELYTRGDGGAWVLREYGEGTELRLSGPDIAISVDSLYRLALEADDGP